MRYYPSDNGDGKFFIAIPQTPTPLDDDRDFKLLMHGDAITVTPISLQASDMDLAAELDGVLRL